MFQVSSENQVQCGHELKEVDGVVLGKAAWMKVRPHSHLLTWHTFSPSPRFCQRPGTFSPRTPPPPLLGPLQRNAWTHAEKVVRSDTLSQTSCTCPEAIWYRFPCCSPFVAFAPWLLIVYLPIVLDLMFRWCTGRASAIVAMRFIRWWNPKPPGCRWNRWLMWLWDYTSITLLV